MTQRGTSYNDLRGTKSPAIGSLLCPHSQATWGVFPMPPNSPKGLNVGGEAKESFQRGKGGRQCLDMEGSNFSFFFCG